MAALEASAHMFCYVALAELHRAERSEWDAAAEATDADTECLD